MKLFEEYSDHIRINIPKSQAFMGYFPSSYIYYWI